MGINGLKRYLPYCMSWKHILFLNKENHECKLFIVTVIYDQVPCAFDPVDILLINFFPVI